MNPVVAAHATGFIRTALVELLPSIPAGEIIVSATADGLLTMAEVEYLDLTGPMCRRL